MAAHYFSLSCLPSLPEGRAQWQQPIHQNNVTNEISAPRKWPRKAEPDNGKRQRERNKGNRMPGTRGSLLPGLLLLAHHSRHRHRPLLLLFIAVSVFLHRRRRSSDVGGPQKVKHCGAAPLIRQEVTHTPLLLPLLRRTLDPRPKCSLLVFPPETVLK